jgi:hypothetical protein
MAHAVRRRPPTAEAWVNSQPILDEICANKLSLGQVYLRGLLFFPASIILQMIHSSIIFSYFIYLLPMLLIFVTDSIVE